MIFNLIILRKWNKNDKLEMRKKRKLEIRKTRK